MTISIIGTGRMGQNLVRVLAAHHAQLYWAGRQLERVHTLLQEVGLADQVQACTHEEAMRADIIILTLWHRDIPAFVQRFRHHLAGKIVIDIANPFTEDFLDFTTSYDTSAAEELQKLLPEARVVGAFKNTFAPALEQPIFPEGVSDVLVTADDQAAKETVMQVLQPLPFRILDAGLLRNNRTIERMTLLEREISIRYGHYPRVSYRLLGQAS